MSVAADRLPGFEGLRLMAAGSVIFSHAFLISTGSEQTEPLTQILGPGNIAGLYGVYTFFVISGFLLARSLALDGSAIRFSVNRVLRIYPGFIFCIVTTALLLGPVGSEREWSDYFRSSDVLNYQTTSLWCLCDGTSLPGVFGYEGADNLETNVNGSLWSLSFEVLSYVLLLGVWLALRDARRVAIVLILLAAISTAIPVVYASMPGVTYTLPYFAAGVAMYTVQQRIGLHLSAAACAAVLLLMASSFGFQRIAFVVFGSYVITFLGSRPNFLSSLASRTGDLSYGVYLFGWPIEQLVKQQTQTSSPWVLMAISFPFVLLFAALSCHLVERPALKLKRPIVSFMRSVLPTGDSLEQRAARLTATLAFLVVAGAILTSDKHWAFITQSLAELSMVSGIGAAFGLAGFAARRLWLQQRSP